MAYIDHVDASLRIRYLPSTPLSRIISASSDVRRIAVAVSITKTIRVDDSSLAIDLVVLAVECLCSYDSK